MPETFKSVVKIASIKTTGQQNIKLPEVQADTYLIEAMELYNWCQDDKELLISAGIDWNMIRRIPILVYALHETNPKWFSEKFKNIKLINRWKTVSKHGYELRNIILRAMEYAYRHNPDLMEEVRLLKNCNGRSDLIQNLKDISAFGKNNSALLVNINYDLNLLDEAADFAEKLNSILISAESGEKNTDIKHERDEACFVLKKAVDEVRAYGQYVFQGNAERLKGYRKIQNNNIKSHNYYKSEKAN